MLTFNRQLFRALEGNGLETSVRAGFVINFFTDNARVYTQHDRERDDESWNRLLYVITNILTQCYDVHHLRQADKGYERAMLHI